MINQQTIQDMVPYIWPDEYDDRLQFALDLKKEFETLIISYPQHKDNILQTMQKISEEAPYLDLQDIFQINQGKTHKLYQFLYPIHSNNTHIDFKQPVTNKTLQKLISDSYRLFNRNILNYQCKLITYAKYYKASLSIFKKSINQMYIDFNTLNFVCSCATRQCITLNRLWSDYDDTSEKYQKLLLSLQKLEQMQKPDDLTHYFNRQSLILFTYSLAQCNANKPLPFNQVNTIYLLNNNQSNLTLKNQQKILLGIQMDFPKLEIIFLNQHINSVRE
ncbi:unnamed protein product [Paramecium sonneborni]|uniref:Uncharacterized protein n=1 Tax=Paramecium sonneborni TaxID=65129 RepID=A0A8S1MMG5_9CILI|nr:unnamed protein product [Paramecium sonneborni]